jgi:hypothetical protein
MGIVSFTLTDAAGPESEQPDRKKGNIALGSSILCVWAS